MKEDSKTQMIQTLDNFMERNECYAIEIYIVNTNSDYVMGKSLAPFDSRKFDSNKNDKYQISWEMGNLIQIPYDQVVACYEERDEYNQQVVHVILKNGVAIELDCVGLRI